MKGLTLGVLVLVACAQAAMATTPSLPDDPITVARLTEALRDADAHAVSLASQLDAAGAALLRARDDDAMARDALAAGKSALDLVGTRLRQMTDLAELRGGPLAAEKRRLRARLASLITYSRRARLDPKTRVRLKLLGPRLLARWHGLETENADLLARRDDIATRYTRLEQRLALLHHKVDIGLVALDGMRRAHDRLSDEHEGNRALALVLRERRNVAAGRLAIARDIIAAGALATPDRPTLLAYRGPGPGIVASSRRLASLHLQPAPQSATTAARARIANASRPVPQALKPRTRFAARSAHDYTLPASAMPALGPILSRFRDDREDRFGRGITIGARSGDTVTAPRDGVIVFAGPFKGYGLLLIIAHKDEYHTLLSGLSQLDVRENQRVRAGDVIGTFESRGEGVSQLYVELRRNGRPINPLPWLTARDSKVRG